MITNFISLKTVFAKLYRDLGINSELNEGDLIEWSSEALNRIGAYSQYEEISECLTLINGKTKLPCGFFKLSDINYKHKPVYWSTNHNKTNYQNHNCRIPVIYHDGINSHSTSGQYTFYINDSYIITNIEDYNNREAHLCMVYLGIKTDEEGYPLIPDDTYYTQALTSYITLMLDYQDWRKGKIADKVFQKSEADWLFYVNSAKGAANMPNIAQLENFKNIMQRLVSRPNLYNSSFKNLTKSENLNL